MRIAVFAALALALTGSAVCQQIKVEKFVLPNGMVVILHEDHAAPVVAINFWYKVGSRDEAPGRSGFAHLFEHLMFMGTKRVPGSAFDDLMEAGGGSNNASTGPDWTNYYSYGPSGLLPTLLWLDADRLEDLGRMMTQEKLDLQREVVRNERRQSNENQPYGKAYLKLNELMYPEGHPYHISVIGTHADLEAATVKDVQDFFATYYVPSNVSLVVAGDFSTAQIKPMIRSLFGTLPRGDAVPRRAVAPATLARSKDVTLADAVPAPRVMVVYHSPAQYQGGDAAMDLTADLLGNGFDSVLYKILVDGGLASDVNASQQSAVLGSLFVIEATAIPGVPISKVERAVDEAVKGFLAASPSKDALQRLVAKREFGTLSSLQSVMAKADRLNEFQFFFSEPNSFKRALDRYRSVTPDGLRGWARRVLEKPRLVLRIVPEIPAPEKNPRDASQALGADRAFVPPAPVEFVLGNGLKGAYWQRPELPLMALEMLTFTGSSTDPAGMGGAATLAGAMVERGTVGMAPAAFEAAMDRLGARYGVGVGVDHVSASLSCLAANFPQAVALMARSLREPRWDAGEWGRLKTQHLAELEQALQDPGSVARAVSMQKLFGAESAYGRPPDGTLASVGALGLADLKAAAARVLNPTRARLFVAGSLGLAEVKSHLEAAFKGWTGPLSPAERAPEPATASSELRVFLVDKPGAVQTVIRFAMPAPTLGDPNREALHAFHAVLGGMFTSRLNRNLREQKGYTYGAGSRLTMTRAIGYAAASSDVRADVTGASLSEFLAEFKRALSGDLSDEEARKARSSLRTDLVGGLATLQGLLGEAVDRALAGRAFGTITADLAEIAALDARGLNGVAARALPYRTGVLVLVGDKTTILKQWPGLDLPQPVEVRADGSAVK